MTDGVGLPALDFGLSRLPFSCELRRVQAMSTKAQAILDEIRTLPPADLQAVGAEVSQILAPPPRGGGGGGRGRGGGGGGPGGGEAEAALGRVLRAEPPGGHPGGSLEPDDPFFQILQKIEEERHRRFPRPPPDLDR